MNLNSLSNYLQAELVLYFIDFNSWKIKIIIPVWFRNPIFIHVFRALYSGALIPWLTMKVNLDALTVAGYTFIIGPLAFSTYLVNLSDAKPNRMNMSKWFGISVVKYHQISLLVNQFNSMFCCRMFIRVIFPGLGVPIICFCTIVLMKDMLSPSIIALLLVITIVMFLTMFLLLTFCANVWSNSVSFLYKISKYNSPVGKQSYRKRLLVSMFPIKIKLGESNFIETSTPLVIMSLCIQQIVNILCLRRKHV